MDNIKHESNLCVFIPPRPAQPGRLEKTCTTTEGILVSPPLINDYAVFLFHSEGRLNNSNYAVSASAFPLLWRERKNVVRAAPTVHLPRRDRCMER